MEDQEKLLEDAKKEAKEQAFFMRKSLDNADLRKGLKFASEMLTQLKTSSLAPRNYYIMFMTIFDYMRGTNHHTQSSRTSSRRTSGGEGA
jgi:vacuolar protein sorting-associated protein 35